MKYESSDVSVIDPVWVVRKRLGNALGDSETREEAIENMEAFGAEIDNNILNSIRNDFQKGMKDVRSDMDNGGGMAGGGPMMQDPIEQFQEEQRDGGPGDDGLSEEEAEERLKKFMRVGSLQVAYRAYDVFKSIAMN